MVLGEANAFNMGEGYEGFRKYSCEEEGHKNNCVERQMVLQGWGRLNCYTWAG